ncbi:MAG: FtsX-like permease family protein [Rikenellaceae bacterium]
MLYLKMIIRSWQRSLLSTLISLVSLTLGLVCSTILILFVIGEYDVTNALGDTSNVYMLEQIDKDNKESRVVKSGFEDKMPIQIAHQFGDVDKMSIAKELYINFKSDKEKVASKPDMAVTTDFCEMFDIPVVEGDIRKTLAAKNEIAVTQRFMQEVYGRDAKIGDVIDGISGEQSMVNGKEVVPIVSTYTITTILDDSKKLPFAYRSLSQLPTVITDEVENFVKYGWDNFVFLKLHPGSSKEVLLDKIKSGFMTKGIDTELILTPFSKVYLDENSQVSNDKFFLKRDPSLLGIGIAIALAVLVIAIFNYVNITMTRAKGKLKNMAGQRIFGASRWNIRLQTVLDTTLVVAISFIISLLLINSFSNKFNAFMDCNISVADIFSSTNLIIVSLLLLLLIVLSSIYIIVKMEISNPIEIFKNPLGKNVKISSIMVIAQFVISVALIAVSINISRQMSYIANNRPDTEYIVRIKTANGDQLPKDFVTWITSYSGVKSYGQTNPFPTDTWDTKKYHFKVMNNANKEMLEFHNIKLVEGRYFDQIENKNNVMVNEAFLRVHNIPRPATSKIIEIGSYHVTQYKIIGVVKDFIYENAHKSIFPLMIQYSQPATSETSFNTLFAKITGNTAYHIDEIRNMWDKMNIGKGSLEVETVAQILKEMHPQDQRLLTMVHIFMYISIMLTALGLFGLAFYTVDKRTKEIALRKIHGSTTIQVIIMLFGTFTGWVSIALVIAVPIAYFLSKEWLSSFAYHVPIAAWVFLATAGVAALVTFITVIFQTWNAASANPAKFIKD